MIAESCRSRRARLNRSRPQTRFPDGVRACYEHNAAYPAGDRLASDTHSPATRQGLTCEKREGVVYSHERRAQIDAFANEGSIRTADTAETAEVNQLPRWP